MGESQDGRKPGTDPDPEHVPAGNWAAANHYLDLDLTPGKEFNKANVLAALKGGTHLVGVAGSWLLAVSPQWQLGPIASATT